MMAFPTPITVYEWPESGDLNRQLAEIVFAEEASAPSLGKSNVGGWHSPNDFILRDTPPMRQLIDRARTMTGELTRAFRAPKNYGFKIEGWANVLRRGQYNNIHNHPNCTWSGVYYVTGNPPPDPEEDTGFSGKIEFHDPRPGATMSFSEDDKLQRQLLLSPKAGTMIMFPSWLHHSVHPYFGREARISIAFNVIIS